MDGLSYSILKIVNSVEWQRHNADPEIFYEYLDSGIWYPDTIHKPYLAAAVTELRQTKREYQILMNWFKKDE